MQAALNYCTIFSKCGQLLIPAIGAVRVQTALFQTPLQFAADSGGAIPASVSKVKKLVLNTKSNMVKGGLVRGRRLGEVRSTTSRLPE